MLRSLVGSEMCIRDSPQAPLFNGTGGSPLLLSATSTSPSPSMIVYPPITPLSTTATTTTTKTVSQTKSTTQQFYVRGITPPLSQVVVSPLDQFGNIPAFGNLRDIIGENNGGGDWNNLGAFSGSVSMNITLSNYSYAADGSVVLPDMTGINAGGSSVSESSRFMTVGDDENGMVMKYLSPPSSPSSSPTIITSTLPPLTAVSYTHLRAHETPEHLVCRLLLEKKNNTSN
eukprot:TRINITY_DN60534_c0_g1_i1.p1 TRINITY_DN60534_c0_g1~~TRINITY_DN60534_c0_g1_i1.p1  ORF type:complete len:230 (-),score=61.32 TRINITY_DN60534_c0_g1_i1:28-717(-)